MGGGGGGGSGGRRFCGGCLGCRSRVGEAVGRGGGGDEHNTGDVALHIPLPHHSQLSLNGGRVLFQFHCPLLPHEMETTTLCQWVGSDRWKL